MKKIIFRNFAIVLLLTTILLTLATYISYYDSLKSQSISEIKKTARLISYEYDIKKLNNIGDRITLIDSDGRVLFDNQNDYRTMENHLDRPEVSDALKSGEGFSIRRSSIGDENRYYYALKMENGKIIRVSRTANGIFELLLDAMPATIGIFLIILIFALFLSEKLAKKIVKSIKIEDLESEDKEFHEELMPFVNAIRKLSKKNSNYVQRIEKEKNTINELLKNTKEGILLLDLDKNIIIVNDSAKMMLSHKDFSGKQILEFSRNLSLQSAIDESIKLGNSTIFIENNKRNYQIFINTTDTGILIIILDVTDSTKAEKIRRDFASNVSHELKTPLTTIKGFSEMIAEGMITDSEDIKKYANSINKESERIISLITHIIRLSEIEETSQDDDFEEIGLLKVTNVVAQSFRDNKNNVTISTNGDESKIFANPIMLEELLFNLIENAVKYNKENGEVTISVLDKAVIVKDTGIGIPAKHRDRIFERFYRVDKSRSKETGGTGLGLSIVKHIAERHNATITLDSEENVGTTIKVQFPS